MKRNEFSHLLHWKRIVWAPDGDDAFDDGSFVLCFEVGEKVRLIGFRSEERYHHDPLTLRDLELPASDFYGILTAWRDAFILEWKAD